jgi:hypothetical protein
MFSRVRKFTMKMSSTNIIMISNSILLISVSLDNINKTFQISNMKEKILMLENRY